jgi:hypothetical protein
VRRGRPRLAVVVELEGPAVAYVIGGTTGEIVRLVADLRGRDLMGEIFAAISTLRDQLSAEELA